MFRPTLTIAIAAWLACGTAQAAVSSDTCLFRCRGASCSLSPAPPASGPGWNEAQPCTKLTVAQGEVELRYMHKNRWFRPPPLKTGEPFRDVLQKYPPDACALLSPPCLQASLDAKVGVVGGHGIDGRASAPGGTGGPCAKALPCGAVLPPAGEWPWRLVDPQARGRVTLRLGRGQPDPGMAPQAFVDIEQGRGVLAAGWLQPGRLYVYDYVDAGGAKASGEFLVMSESRAVAFGKRVAAREAQGLRAADARFDVLMENDLFWDALQMDLEGTR